MAFLSHRLLNDFYMRYPRQRVRAVKDLEYFDRPVRQNIKWIV